MRGGRHGEQPADRIAARRGAISAGRRRRRRRSIRDHGGVGVALSPGGLAPWRASGASLPGRHVPSTEAQVRRVARGPAAAPGRPPRCRCSRAGSWERMDGRVAAHGRGACRLPGNGMALGDVVEQCGASRRRFMRTFRGTWASRPSSSPLSRVPGRWGRSPRVSGSSVAGAALRVLRPVALHPRVRRYAGPHPIRYRPRDPARPAPRGLNVSYNTAGAAGLPIGHGKHVTPRLVVRDAGSSLDFYRRALGAEVSNATRTTAATCSTRRSPSGS